MGDVNRILTDDDLVALRAAYDPKMMLDASAAAITGRDPASAGFVNFATETFFDAKRFPPDARERCFLVLLALTSKGSGLTLAVHIYWGLMEGLSVRDVADTLLFAGVYTGMPNLASALISMEDALNALKDLVARSRTLQAPDGAEAQGENPIASAKVVGALIERFG